MVKWHDVPRSDGKIEYCFAEQGFSAADDTIADVPENTKGYFRQAIQQAESEINALGSCLHYIEVPKSLHRPTSILSPRPPHLSFLP